MNPPCTLHGSVAPSRRAQDPLLDGRSSRRRAMVPRAAGWAMILLLVTAFVHAQGDATLTYEAVLDLAADAPTVAFAQQALERSERQAATNDAWFDLALTGGYEQRDGTTTVTDGADPVETEEGSFDPIALNVTFDPAWGGATRDARARAAATLASARADLEAALRTARIDAVRAFQDVLYADGARRLARDEVALARARAEAIRQRLATGAASDLDVAQADLDVARAEQSLATTERDLEQARTRLVTTLGLPLDQPLPMASGPLPSAPAVPSLAHHPADAIAARPDVQAAVRDVADAERTTAASVRDVLPVLTFSARYLTGSDAMSTTLAASMDSTNLTPTLSASWDPDTGLPGLADGGTSSELRLGLSLRIVLSPALPDALAAVRISEDQARAREATTRDQAILTVRVAYDAAIDAAERASLAHDAARLAREALRIATLRLEAGSGSEASRERARIDAARAELDAERADGAQRIAVFRLLDAIGASPSELE